MAVSSRATLVSAAQRLIVERGYADTTVDGVCRAAGVSKGAFFHHFRSKDEIAAAALDGFVSDLVAWQGNAPGADDADPLQRALAFVDHNIRFAEETPPEPFGCLLGNVAAELSETHPALRAASASGMKRWTEPLARDLREAAKAARLPPGDAEALAEHFSHAFQGGIVLARAKHDPSELAVSLRHYRRYLLMMLDSPKRPARRKRT